MNLRLKSASLGGGLLLLAACGGAPDEVTATDPVPATPTVAAAPTPTVTPNAEPLASTHPNSIQPETTLTLSAEG
ncbi:MAG: hypothetical protein AAGH49_06380, partial [Pseudomonadota bacterium]